MSLFAIADLHLSFSADKPMDVFSGWEDYQSRLEKNWRGTIRDTDTVVLPGDISWAMSLEQAADDFRFLETLPGKKIILKGNHDYWWSTRKKMELFLSENGFTSISILHNNCVATCGVCVCGTRGWFYDAACEDKKVLLREAGRLEASIAQGEKTGLETVAFLHYPPVYGEFICDEIMNVLKRHGIRRCYYGHLHGRAAGNAVEGPYEGILFRLISADHLRFQPLLIE